MVELSEFEKETLAWGSRYVKNPWAEMIEIFKKLAQTDGKLPLEERRLTLEVLPWVKVDMKTAFNLVTFLLYDILRIPNASMFTIIMGEKGDKIIWSSIEHETDGGVYKEFIPIKDRIDEPWAKEAAQLIVQGKDAELFDFLKNWTLEQEQFKHIEIGIVKIAGIRFFSEYRKAWETSERGKNLEKVIINVMEATKNVISNNWIKFIPYPYGIDVLFDIFRNNIDIDFQSLKNTFKKLLELNLSIGISVLTDEWGTFLKIKNQKKKKKISIEMNQDKADEVFNKLSNSKKGINLKKFTDKVRKKFKTRDAIGIDGDSLKKLLVKVMKASEPWDIAKIDKGFGLFLPGVKQYKEVWAISPEPLFLKGYVKWLARRLGYDYDLSRFSDWWLQELAIFGLLNAVGLQFKIVLFLLDDKGKMETAMLIHFDNGQLISMETFPDEMVTKLKNIFRQEKNKTEAVCQARFELWHDYGWIKYAIGIKPSILREMIDRMLKLRGIFMIFRALSFYYFIRKFMAKELFMSPPLPLEEVLKDIGLRDLMKLGKAVFGVLFDLPGIEYPDLVAEGYV
ncbi:MAG: hypothetical protein ACTSRG_03610 [Candidatus Helarchaeota archaeon]